MPAAFSDAQAAGARAHEDRSRRETGAASTLAHLMPDMAECGGVSPDRHVPRSGSEFSPTTTRPASSRSPRIGSLASDIQSASRWSAGPPARFVERLALISEQEAEAAALQRPRIAEYRRGGTAARGRAPAGIGRTRRAMRPLLDLRVAAEVIDEALTASTSRGPRCERHRTRSRCRRAAEGELGPSSRSTGWALRERLEEPSTPAPAPRAWPSGCLPTARTAAN